MISDSSGVMVYGRYDQFLREVLKLPTAVFEGPSFGYTEQSARSCFSQQVGKNVCQEASSEQRLLSCVSLQAVLRQVIISSLSSGL